MKRLTTSLLLVGATTVALTGCTETMGPRTQTGAATGAMIGGLIGATRPGGGNLGKAAVGAVIGGAIGGAIGQELDRQAGDLRRDIGNDEVTITNTGSELIVTLPNDILFATDSAIVSNATRGDLAGLARNLRDYPNSTVEIVGHTDNIGDPGYNLSLSRRRAAAVAAVLFDNGVSAGRVVTIGRGEDQPIASNYSPQGRAQNRRVEIIIRPNR
ncbi:OmpA family protein [Aliiroseovarius subalbicans]|uniref:OmpA family protein n=1 Tax=Aliiroseovarius subalbicans TaxID=2925840 RepID=UPI001F56300A|nr:OmpA family protein [Aliiroseovarius subalbicans]MCI2400706.1 OmpA family protein [Aliiroseovarius subalbicans]